MASLRALLLALSALSACAWQQWDWTGGSPGARRGHSMVISGTRLLMFGGRADDVTVEHNPMTYQIEEVNGTLQFATYDGKSVIPCANATSNVYANETDASNATCVNEIVTGAFYNDVWAYELNCTRWADGPCTDDTWVQIHPGAKHGGCTIILGEEICSVPSERWLHGAALFNDSTMLVYGGFSHRCEDYCDDMWEFDLTDNTWVQLISLGEVEYSPGKRWRFSALSDGWRLIMFGGHRLWHGFSLDNTADNQWDSFEELPEGGYLDDLWTMTKETLEWSTRDKLETCFSSPGDTWETRNDIACETTWPEGRASHVAVLKDDGMWMHGGYRTFFPYPSSTSVGAERGTQAGDSKAGFSPYPSLPYYLDDLWIYNLTTGYWTEVEVSSTTKPSARHSHTVVMAGEVLFLFGGYSHNYHYDDTWLYNFSTNTWLEKYEQVYALYPDTCTDDLEYIENNNCTLEDFDIYSNSYGASGPRQYWHNKTDETTGASQRTRCTSVFGQPTRDALLDGAYGRASEDIFIAQPRRQAPGWDGCRDRYDGRTDLDAALQWKRPSQRSRHAAAYSPDYNIILMYGGYGYDDEWPYDGTTTHASSTRDDFWSFHLETCSSNCSLHGVCHFGRCFCDDGYYGIDCSNTSCPGDYCYYDEITNEQICTHCCHAGWTHSDAAYGYQADVQKIACSADNPGESHGVCDGFGTCQCRPPYITADCSVTDCPNNCTGHGWCSVESPVSRCMCEPGWFGDDCSQQACLNNCSYPNGVCNHNSGRCNCEMWWHPYNRSREYHRFQGDDCSFVVAFAAGSAVAPAAWVAWGVVGMVWALAR